MMLGERLYNLRKEHNLSQEEVAEKLDVTRQTISKWENGSSMPDFDKIVPICELYGISTDELLKGKEESRAEVKSDNTQAEKYDTIEHNTTIRVHKAKTISISVFLYFLSIVFIVIGEKYINEQILVGLFLLIIGGATAYLIYNLVKLPGIEKPKDNEKYKRVDGIVSALFTLIYLVISFLTGAWHITWLIWIAFAAVVEIIHIILDLKENKKDER